MNSLSIEHLSVTYPGAGQPVAAVRDLWLELAAGECIGIVGESGSGKTAVARAVMGLLEHRGATVEGRISLAGEDLLAMPSRGAREWRRGRVGLIFQDAATALNPVKRVGPQIAEAVRVQLGLDRSAAAKKARELLSVVEIPEVASRYRQYPFEFSGGMRQRAMIAMALAGEPDVLVADEPTTALDVTVQSGVLDLMKRLQESRGMSLLLISHDIGVVASLADRVSVMYGGSLVETGPVDDVFSQPAHPYTRGLLRCLPRLESVGQGGERLRPLPGEPPDPRSLPQGCSFHPRCPLAEDVCAREQPVLAEVNPDRDSACHFWEKCIGARAHA